MCHAMSFSARAHFLWYCGKKQIEMWFTVVCTLTDNEYVSFLVSRTFFSYYFRILSEFVKVFERKVWRVQAVICIMQRVHFQVRVGVFSCQDKYLFRYLWYCDKKQIEYALAWSVLLSTTIRVITVLKMLWTREAHSESATNWATSQSARFA